MVIKKKHTTVDASEQSESSAQVLTGPWSTHGGTVKGWPKCPYWVLTPK